jgi:hypothetical protein
MDSQVYMLKTRKFGLTGINHMLLDNVSRGVYSNGQPVVYVNVCQCIYIYKTTNSKTKTVTNSMVPAGVVWFWYPPARVLLPVINNINGCFFLLKVRNYGYGLLFFKCTNVSHMHVVWYGIMHSNVSSGVYTI